MPLPQTAERIPSFKRTDTGDVSGAVSDDALIAMWLSGRPANTRRAYGADINKFRCHVSKAIQHVTAKDLIDFAESLARLATSTQHRRLSSVKSLFSYSHKLGYIRFDPAAALRLPKTADNRAGKLISPEAVRNIIQHTTGRNRLLLRTLYLTGLRESELIAMTAEDIRENATGYALSVTGKGTKVRHMAIPPKLARDLLAYCQADQIFPINASTVYRIVRSAGERAGYRVTPHSMRHAHASHSLDSGAGLPLVKEGLGHSSLATTSIYIHCRPNDGAGLYLEDQTDGI